MKFGHLEGVPQPQLGDLRTILANYLTTGMILQTWKKQHGWLLGCGWLVSVEAGFSQLLIASDGRGSEYARRHGFLQSEACSGETYFRWAQKTSKKNGVKRGPP